MAGRVRIDDEKCTGCMRCMQASFPGDFRIGPNGKAEVDDPDAACIECGHCAAVCPTGAIHLDAFDGAAFEPVNESDRPAYDQLMALLKARRSRREFKPDPVPAELIQKLLDAAVQAPAAMNRQTIRYTVVTDRDALRGISARGAAFLRYVVRLAGNPLGRIVLRALARGAYTDIVSMLPKMDRIAAAHEAGRDSILYNAPCAIILHAPKSDSMAGANSSYIASNILLAAETLGLGACIIGFVTEASGMDPCIGALARIPKGHRICCTIVLGYPKFSYTCTIPKKAARVSYVQAICPPP